VPATGALGGTAQAARPSIARATGLANHQLTMAVLMTPDMANFDGMRGP
jgi:hypothetical protein